MYTLTYIYTSIYQNQTIRVAKLCFLFFFLLKIPHESGGQVTLTLTLRFNFCGTHTYTCPLLAHKIQ